MLSQHLSNCQNLPPHLVKRILVIAEAITHWGLDPRSIIIPAAVYLQADGPGLKFERAGVVIIKAHTPGANRKYYSYLRPISCEFVLREQYF